MFLLVNCEASSGIVTSFEILLWDSVVSDSFCSSYSTTVVIPYSSLFGSS